MIPFCNTPAQSVLAAFGGGIAGGALGFAAGLDAVGVALLAGALGGLTDLGIHVARRDTQFRRAVTIVRERARQFVSGAP